MPEASPSVQRRAGRWRSRRQRTSPLGRSVLPLAIDDPRHTKAIGDHNEALGPKGLLERQPHLSTAGQGFEHALGIGRALDLKRQRESLRRLILTWRNVSRLQRLAADRDAAM